MCYECEKNASIAGSAAHCRGNGAPSGESQGQDLAACATWRVGRSLGPHDDARFN